MHGDGLSLLLEPDALENTKLKRGNATNELQARISGLKVSTKPKVCCKFLHQMLRK
jgi:hypothetical protein